MKIPLIIEERSFELGASIGLTFFPDDGDDPDTLLQHADVAMYSAKKASANYMRYNAQLDAGNLSRLELVGELREAISLNQLTVLYQPHPHHH